LIKYDASLYDGKSALEQEVTLSTQGSTLFIENKEINLCFKVKDLLCEAPFSKSPLIIDLPNGSRIECHKYDQELLNHILKRESHLLFWLERNKLAITFTFICTIIFAVFFVQKIEPQLAHSIAQAVDQKVLNRFDDRILSIIDSQYVKKSKLPTEVQFQLREKILEYAHREDIRVLFREGSQIGANAFALGGRTIIITDELIQKLNNEKLVLSIAFHELGHLKHRHFFERTVSAILYNFLFVFALNDLTGFTESLAQAGMGLIFLKNSRAHESEADEYSFHLLFKAGFSPVCFATGMQLLAGKGLNQSSQNGSDFFSTHPSTQKRISEVFKKFPNAGDCLYDPSKPIYERSPVEAAPELINILKEK
tara:strand:+ start:3587 stop:4687 length:1101 start_codon:yes stop_codon:yes gene_type:complete